jgi:Sec-independent protein translocase protein TatA
MKKKFLIIIVVLIVCLGPTYFILSKIGKNIATIPNTKQNIAETSNAQGQNLNKDENLSSKDEEPKLETQSENPQISQKIEQKVPFSVQAPFANWKDQIFQNACEEAAMIMAMGWVKDVEKISVPDAQKQIEEIVNFENKKFGYNTDTDIYDMQVVFQEFFNYKNVNARENITLSDIKNEIQKGNIVLAPALGRALGNPNYTAPGPVAHMLVIIGYDPTTKKFITNDSGTKHGSEYLYAENVLFNAIWEYPSGAEVPKVPGKVLKKGMIVVSKSQ